MCVRVYACTVSSRIMAILGQIPALYFGWHAYAGPVGDKLSPPCILNLCRGRVGCLGRNYTTSLKVKARLHQTHVCTLPVLTNAVEIGDRIFDTYTAWENVFGRRGRRGPGNKKRIVT